MNLLDPEKSLIVEMRITRVAFESLEEAMFGGDHAGFTGAPDVVGAEGPMDQMSCIHFTGGFSGLVELALSEAGFDPKSIGNLYIWLADQNGRVRDKLNAGSSRRMVTKN